MDPRVGIAVFALNSEGKFIVGKRKGSHGAGTWALPGGHLEFGEAFETCAARETLEETDLKIRDVRYLTATNSVFEVENKHYITIFMGAVCEEGAEPKILEPEKCEAWEWVSWDELQRFGQAGSEFEGRELFLPITSLFEQRPDFRVIQLAAKTLVRSCLPTPTKEAENEKQASKSAGVVKASSYHLKYTEGEKDEAYLISRSESAIDTAK